MQEFVPLLSRCTLFQNIRQEDLPPMLSCLGARVTTVKKNQLIMREGEPARSVGIVLSGGAQIIKEDYYGNRSIVARIEPGELFGESFACAGVDALPVSVEATADSQIMLINCHRITVSCTNACGFHSRLIYNLLQVVATKNLIFNQKIEITSKRTTREKLMTYLLSQAKTHNSSSFTIPYDRQSLADYLGVERSAMSAEIGKLRKEGILECDKSRFKLLKAGQEVQ